MTRTQLLALCYRTREAVRLADAELLRAGWALARVPDKSRSDAARQVKSASERAAALEIDFERSFGRLAESFGGDVRAATQALRDYGEDESEEPDEEPDPDEGCCIDCGEPLDCAPYDVRPGMRCEVCRREWLAEGRAAAMEDR